jgi:glycosyltransferase involved in cell wall biosynthesis
MKIVLVIHGYPMRYNAGSEVYTQALAQALAHHHEVHVFSRQQNKFVPDYTLHNEVDSTDPRVALHVVNLPQSLDQYRHSAVDEHFGALLDRIQPDVVHIGHLNHLSTSLVFEAHTRAIPLVFTLHDFWLMCPRGQFLQIRPQHGTDLWPLCGSQDDRTCADRCYARYFSGACNEEETDLAYWTHWVQRRMVHIREVCAVIDLFIAPSRRLLQRFREDFRLADWTMDSSVNACRDVCVHLASPSPLPISGPMCLQKGSTTCLKLSGASAGSLYCISGADR